MLLAGDVGATKTTLGVFSDARGPRDALNKRTFPSKPYQGLDAIVRDFLAEIDVEVTRAAFGVAGPVIEDRVEVTNLPWVIDGADLGDALELSRVVLLNDLAAIANAVPLLEPDEVHTLQAGRADATGAVAVVAPGTGLGEAFLTWDGEQGRYHPHASEGGHTDFGPTTPRQIQLLRYLWARHEHVSYELVCSGMGIPNLYAYFRSGGYAEEPEWLAQELRQADDPTPVIVQAGLDQQRPCELCQVVLDAFVSILGAEAGNLALKVMATGGVYLGGGIPPRILPALERDGFMASFHNKGRHSDLMTQMPVHVILNSDVALLGVAGYGLNS